MAKGKSFSMAHTVPPAVAHFFPPGSAAAAAALLALRPGPSAPAFPHHSLFFLYISSFFAILFTTCPGTIVHDVRNIWAKALLRQADFSVAHFSVL